MIYWLIPYLVAYNASDAGNWRYGPEHVFKVEVRGTGTTDKMSVVHLNVDMHLACRTMNASLIQCTVDSAMADYWNTDEVGTTSSTEFHGPQPMSIGNDVFQVEFNENGVSKLRLINTTERFKLDMIRVIFDTVNWGMNMSGTTYGSYDGVERSMIGSCETTFVINGTAPSKEETKVEKPIYGYSFDVPAFEGRTGNEPIVIEKSRNVDRCSDQTLYLFGSIDGDEFDKNGAKKKTKVTSSRSRIYLGRNSFSGYTRTIGMLDATSSPVASTRGFLNTDGFIHLSLVAIRPAKEEIRPMGNSVNAGVDIVWPTEGA